MADLSLKVKPIGRNKAKSTKGYIVFKLTHKGKRRFISTGIRVNLSDFEQDQLEDYLPLTYKKLLSQKDLYTRRLFELFDLQYQMDIDEIKGYIFKSNAYHKKATNIFDIFEAIAREIETNDPANSYATLIRSTSRNLEKWWKRSKLNLDTLTYPLLKEYEKWLKEQFHEVSVYEGRKVIGTRNQPLKPNTISIHLRNIRRAFNWAIDHEIISPKIYPFRKFKNERKRNPLRIFNTPHRDLTPEQLRTLRDLDLSDEYRRVQQARDMLMLSFYMVGMNLIDIWKFGWTAVPGSHAQYVRTKTQKGIQFTIPGEALEIIKKYLDDKGNFTIPQRIKTYDGFKAEINKGLKYVGEHIGVPGLTFYAGRHTWSTLAETKCGIPEATVKLALTHGAKTVTGVYINKDREMIQRIDIAHRKVLDLVAGFSSADPETN